MYLSRVELDPTRRSTMAALAAPQKLHGAVETAFPGERRRRLWRLDQVNGRLWLLLLSEDRPELTGIADQFGVADSPRWESRTYDPLLERIAPDSVWRFRLTANPTKSCPKESQRGEVRAHCTVEHQKEWLLERAGKHGFSLDPEEFTVTQIRWKRFYKGRERRPVTLLAVTYEGVLRITDPEAFRNALVSGIGRGKAYGMGLLTVMGGGRSHG